MSDILSLKTAIRSSCRENPLGYRRYGNDKGVWRPVFESYTNAGLFMNPDGVKVKDVRIDLEVNQDEMLEELMKVRDSQSVELWLKNWGLPIQGGLPPSALVNFSAEVRWLNGLIRMIRAVERETEDKQWSLNQLKSWFVEDRKSGIWQFLNLPVQSFNKNDMNEAVNAVSADLKDVSFYTFKPTAEYLQDDQSLRFFFNAELGIVFDVLGLTEPIPTYPLKSKHSQNGTQEVMIVFARCYVQDCLNHILAGIKYRLDWTLDESRAAYLQAGVVCPVTQVQAIGLALARKLTDYSEVRWCPHPECQNQIHGRKDKKHCGKPKCAKWVNRNGK